MEACVASDPNPPAPGGNPRGLVTLVDRNGRSRTIRGSIALDLVNRMDTDFDAVETDGSIS